MSLAEQIASKRREIKTDGYPISIGEWISMYERGELDIHPEFQRFYRWSDAQKSSLIESILLGIPLPAIFVSQRADGVWDVVDGLQRLSTIFQFVGILRDEKKKPVKALTLQSTKYLPDLDGVKWEAQDPKKSLASDLQLLVKRSKISASIVLKESDESTKYDLFERLNTGGSQLSPQEVRNCLLVMVNSSFFEWLRALPKDDNFILTTSLSDRPLEEAYDLELVLRFILLSTMSEDEVSRVRDVGNFLTERMTEVAMDKKFKRAAVSKLFSETFAILAEVLEEDAFKRFNKKKGRHEGGFLLSLFEVVALGVAYNLSRNTLCAKSKIAAKVQEMWSDRKFTDWAASGVTASRRLPRLVPYGRNLFKK